MSNIFTNEFEHVVLVNREHRKDKQVTIWLFDNIKSNSYEILYAQRQLTTMDGINETQSLLWGAAFKNEEDAMAFKLRWL